MIDWTLFYAIFLLFRLSAAQGDSIRPHTTFLASDPRILYFPQFDPNANSSCSQPSTPGCDSRWWQEDNPDKTSGFRQVYSTRGPHTMLQFVFTKSTSVQIIAYVDPNVETRSIVVLNGQPGGVNLPGPNLFGKYDLNAGATNTLCVEYNDGSGNLSVTGFYLEPGAEVLDASSANHPCIPQSATTSPHSTASTTSHGQILVPATPPSALHSSTGRKPSSTILSTRTHSDVNTASVQSSEGVNPTYFSSSPDLPITSASMPDASVVPTDGQHSSRRSQDGIIAGATAAGTLLLVLLCTGFYYIQRRRRRAASQEWLRSRAAARIAMWDEPRHWTQRPGSPGVLTSMDWEKEEVGTEPSLSREPDAASRLSSEIVSTAIGFTSASRAGVKA